MHDSTRRVLISIAALTLTATPVALGQSNERSDRNAKNDRADRNDRIATVEQRPAEREAGGRPEAIEKALRARYGETPTEIVGSPREINGIRTYAVRISGDEKGRNNTETQALVTEFGDFVYSGSPIEFKRLPKGVQDARQVLRAEPSNVQRFILDEYFFDVRRSDDKLYRVRYDAVGRLRDIANPHEVEATEPTKFEKVGNDASKQVTDTAARYAGKDARLKDVYRDPNHPGFYAAKYQDEKGKEVLVTLNENGDVYQIRKEMDVNDIPRPIRDSFEKMFDLSKVKWAYHSNTQFGQFQQRTEDGETVTIAVRPDGEILHVRNSAGTEDERATTAGFREGASGARERSDTTERSDRTNRERTNRERSESNR